MEKKQYMIPECETISLGVETSLLNSISGVDSPESYEFDDTLLDLSDFGSMLI